MEIVDKRPRREGGREGWGEGGRKQGREGGRKQGREGGREEAREGGREGGSKGGSTRRPLIHITARSVSFRNENPQQPFSM